MVPVRFAAVIVLVSIGFSVVPVAAQPRTRPPAEHREVQTDPPGVRPAVPPIVVPPQTGPTPRGGLGRVQVNTDALGNNIMGDAANEPSIAIDPTDPNKMAIGWRQFDTVTSNFRQAGNSHSADGGQTWVFHGVLDPLQFRSDPVLASDADGVFYYSSLSSLSSIEVFKSVDGGATWPTPVPAFGGDKQWIAVDRTGGPGRGNVYQIWNVQFSCCQPADFTRTIDGGATYNGPFVGPVPSMKWGTMDVGPNGTLYLAGSKLNSGAGHRFSRSTNAQDPMTAIPTFDASADINLGGTTAIGNTPNPAGLMGQVWIATDHSGGATHGNLYVLGSVNPPTSDPLDVMFIRSTDDGVNWSSPVRVNDDPIGGNAYQWFGTMAVAPNGRIDVVWNDTRNTVAADWSELYYAFSVDAGENWSDNVPLSEAFDSHLGWPQQNKLGDYYDMVSFNDAAHLAFAATFNGEQDVYYLRIAPDCNQNGLHDGTDILDGLSLDCDGDGRPDECEFPGCAGILLADMNCDGLTDVLDIPRFVDTLVGGTYTCQADLNQNGVVEGTDVAPFTAALLGP